MALGVTLLEMENARIQEHLIRNSARLAAVERLIHRRRLQDRRDAARNGGRQNPRPRAPQKRSGGSARAADPRLRWTVKQDHRRRCEDRRGAARDRGRQNQRTLDPPQRQAGSALPCASLDEPKPVWRISMPYCINL